MTIQEAIKVLENVISFDYTEEIEAIGVVLKALAELKESKKEGKWKPKEGEKYWYRAVNGVIYSEINNNCFDLYRINNTPIFKTEEQCKKYWHFMDTVKEKSYEFSKEEWEDITIKKYIILYNYARNDLYIDFFGTQSFLNGIYFKEKSDAQYIIDNFKDELMEFFVERG